MSLRGISRVRNRWNCSEWRAEGQRRIARAHRRRGGWLRRFSRLDDSSDLWQILVMLAERKAIDEVRRQTAAKRGGDQVRSDSAFTKVGDGASGQRLEQFADSDRLSRILGPVDGVVRARACRQNSLLFRSKHAVADRSVGKRLVGLGAITVALRVAGPGSDLPYDLRASARSTTHSFPFSFSPTRSRRVTRGVWPPTACRDRSGSDRHLGSRLDVRPVWQSLSRRVVCWPLARPK